MRGLLAIATGLTALVLVSTAYADAPAPISPSTLASGAGNNCAAKFYPAAAIRSGEQGSTTLDVHVEETGKVTKVDIDTSSGFADLDEASRDCVVTGWHFKPATQDGKSVASIKKFRIVWKLTQPNIEPHLQAPMEMACADLFSDAANRWTAYQSATLQFRISATGAVVHPFVGISSGDALFDAKAVQCATRLKYTPPIEDGTPIEVSWNAAVRWSPHTGLAYADAYRLRVFCGETSFPPVSGMATRQTAQ